MNIDNVIDYLDNQDNDLLSQVDHDDDKLIEVASLLSAASELVKLAQDLALDDADEKIADGVLEDLVTVANSFDESGDEVLIKKASVLDELLLSVAADKKILLKNKIAATQKLRDLREKFKESQKEIELRKRQRKVNRIDEAEKVLKQSDILKQDDQVSPMKHARESRHCPDHPGVSVYRIADATWQCSLDRKIYDFNTGFKKYNGEQVSGGSLADNNYFPEFVIPSWSKETKN
jgi:hypothetical protein